MIHGLGKTTVWEGGRAIVPLSPLLPNAVLTCVCTPWDLVFESLNTIRIRRAKRTNTTSRDTALISQPPP
jgi:hypothetical protein